MVVKGVPVRQMINLKKYILALQKGSLKNREFI